MHLVQIFNQINQLCFTFFFFLLILKTRVVPHMPKVGNRICKRKSSFYLTSANTLSINTCFLTDPPTPQTSNIKTQYHKPLSIYIIDNWRCFLCLRVTHVVTFKFNHFYFLKVLLVSTCLCQYCVQCPCLSSRLSMLI